MSVNNNFMVIGCGARESAIIRNLKRNPENKIYGYAPHPHPEIVKYCTSFRYFKKTPDLKQCLEYCLFYKIRYVIIGSENYINSGLSTYLESNIKDLKCICPGPLSARIETSKYFARNLVQTSQNLQKYNPQFMGINKATSLCKIVEFITTYNNNIVVKADGLCSGKGVKVWGVHLHSLSDIIEYIYELLITNIDDDIEYPVVIEEKIISDNEFSFITFTDGITAQHSFPIKDFKRLHSGNTGPNTGSMGCIYDNNSLKYLTPELIEEAKSINEVIITTLNTIDFGYKGALYGSYIVDKNGNLKIIEFNCRLGDPEGVMIMNRMKTDFGIVCKMIAHRTLDRLKIEFDEQTKYAVCKYLVPNGYPIKKCDDFKITLPSVKGTSMKDVYVGSVRKDEYGYYYGTSSRTLVVYKTSDVSLEHAENKCDVILQRLSINNKNYNKDLFYYRKRIIQDYHNEETFLTKYSNENENLMSMNNPLINDTVYVNYENSDDISDSDDDSEEEHEQTMYEQSGVNIEQGDIAVRNISQLVKSTHDENVLGQIGGFGGLFDMAYFNSACLNPVLVTSIDGVGTKSIFTIEHYDLDGYFLLGQDIVNHCVNDILVQGAIPLFFTD